MVIYYTGTGNSRFIAKIIAEKLDDTLVDATELMKQGKFGKFESERPYVFVCPTYAWQMPKIFVEFIKRSKFSGNKFSFFVMTCGSDIGNAEKQIKELCEEADFKYKGVMEIEMPENYIAMFTAPEQAEAKKIVAKAVILAREAAEIVGQNKYFPHEEPDILDKVKSGIVNDIFYKYMISAKKFYATDKCIGCKKCVTECPLNNIKIVDGKPQWGNQCTHCMACICKCPTEAIEYGKHTKGKRRYSL